MFHTLEEWGAAYGAAPADHALQYALLDWMAENGHQDQNTLDVGDLVWVAGLTQYAVCRYVVSLGRRVASLTDDDGRLSCVGFCDRCRLFSTREAGDRFSRAAHDAYWSRQSTFPDAAPR